VRHTHAELDHRLVETIRRPAQLLVAVAIFRAGIVWIAPSYILRTYLARAFTAAIYLAVAWVCMRFIDIVTTRIVTAMSGRQKTSAVSSMPLMRRTLKVLVAIVAAVATLNNWGYDTTALLAGLGVGGLAVALAAQKTIENLFGGLAITTDKPVLVGDFCAYGDKSGTVEDIGLRSTRIRTIDRTVVTIPNASFSGMQIENFGKRDKISFRPVLQLRRDTTAEQLRAVLPKIRRLLADHPKIEKTPRVRFLAISAHSLDVEIYSYILTADYDEFLVIQEQLLLDVLDIVAAQNIVLAVPAQLSLVG